MFDAGMHGEKPEVLREGDQADRLRPAIEVDHMVFLPENQGNLVGESAAHSDEFIFRAPADLGEFEGGNFEREQPGEQDGCRHRERGRTRQSGTRRQVRGKIRIESAGCRPGPGKHFGDAKRIVLPTVTGLETGISMNRDNPADPLACEDDFSVIPSPAGCGDSHLNRAERTTPPL